jgi:predicted ester cyclase
MGVSTPSAVVAGFITEVWNEARFDRTPSYIDERYELGDLGRGPKASAANARSFREIFPDLTVQILETVQQGTRVAAWMRLSGTQQEEFRGHPPSRRHATWDEVGFFTVEGDKIVAGRYLADMFSLRKALGIISATMQ